MAHPATLWKWLLGITLLPQEKKHRDILTRKPSQIKQIYTNDPFCDNQSFCGEICKFCCLRDTMKQVWTDTRHRSGLTPDTWKFGWIPMLQLNSSICSPWTIRITSQILLNEQMNNFAPGWMTATVLLYTNSFDAC